MKKEEIVLFVEDDQIDRMAFVRFARANSFEYEYEIASSYIEAEEMLDSREFDLIISDYQLGDGTAFDLLKIIADIPLIFVTGLGDQETAVKAMKAGASDYIIKDRKGAHLKTLPITIDNALKRKYAEIELQNYREHLEELVETRTAELRNEIDERKKIEDRLRDSEEKFRGVAERSSDIIFLVDLGAKISYAAPSVTKILGYKPEELIGLASSDMLSPENDAKVKSYIPNIMQGEEVEHLEIPLRKADGTFADIEWTATPIFDENDVIGIQLIGRDVTERKIVQEALQKSEALFRNVVSASKDAMISINSDGRIALFNPAAEVMFGWSMGEMIGQSLDPLIPDKYRSDHPMYVASFLKTGKPDGAIDRTVELAALRKNGDEFPVDLTLSKGHRGDEIFVLAVVRDITIRKKQEKAIQYRLDFEKLISGISSRFVGISDIDASINKTLEDIGKFSNADRSYVFAIEKDVMTNTHEWSAENITPQKEHLQNIGIESFPLWAKYLEEKDSLIIRNLDELPENAVSERRFLEFQDVKSFVLYRLLINGAGAGFIGVDYVKEGVESHEDALSLLQTSAEIIGNAFDRKRAEEEILQLNLNLEQKVKDRTSLLNDTLEELRYENEERKRTHNELEKANIALSESQNTIEQEAKRLVILNEKLRKSEKQLKEINDSKDKFFSIIAHDLKGPFSGFLGLSELIAEEHEHLDKEAIAEMSVSLHKGAKQLFNLLENLLEWSRIQRGTIHFEPSNIRLSKSVNSNIELISNNSERKNIIIMNKVDVNFMVFADYNMLNTIFRNLLSNAVKFTDKDGVIRIIASPKNDGEQFIEVAVIDNGVGMDLDTSNKIFQMDSKHSTLGTENERGTGLGLLLCKELVEKQGGKIWVESQVGVGSKFKFTIPTGKK